MVLAFVKHSNTMPVPCNIIKLLGRKSRAHFALSGFLIGVIQVLESHIRKTAILFLNTQLAILDLSRTQMRGKILGQAKEL